MSVSFIAYENNQRGKVNDASSKAGVTLTSAKCKSVAKRLLSAFSAWREERQKQKSLRKTQALDGKIRRDISCMSAAELSEHMQGKNSAASGRGIATEDVLAGPVLAWPAPKKRD